MRVRNTGLPGSKKLLLQHFAVVPSIQYRITVRYQRSDFWKFYFPSAQNQRGPHIATGEVCRLFQNFISAFCSVYSFLQTQFASRKTRIIQNHPTAGTNRGVASVESFRSVRDLGKNVSGKPYPRLCNARRSRLEPEIFLSQAVRLYRLHQVCPSNGRYKCVNQMFLEYVHQIAN